MVVSLDLQLESDARLFQEVRLDVGGGDLQSRAEVDSDELTLEEVGKVLKGCVSTDGCRDLFVAKGWVD